MQNHRVMKKRTGANFHVETEASSRSIVVGKQDANKKVPSEVKGAACARALSFYLLEAVLLQLSVECCFADTQHSRRRNLIAVGFPKRP